MIRATVALLAVLLAAAAQAEKAPKPGARAPYLVLTTVARGSHFRHRPLRMNAQPVSFVLYSDGSVIYEDPRRVTGYSAAKLTPGRLSEIRDLIDRGSTWQLEDRYVPSRRMHPVIRTFILWRAGDQKRIKVFGSLEPGSEARALVPASLIEIYDRIVGFDMDAEAEAEREGVRPWTPDQLEVLLTPTLDESGVSVAWPAAWDRFERTARPQICPRPYCRVSGDAVVDTRFEAFVVLPGSEFTRLRSLDLGKGDMQPTILLGDRTWYLSYYLPFPGEEAWLD